MSIRLTNLAFFTILGVVVGALLAPACGRDCYLTYSASGGVIGLLLGCLLNVKVPPAIPPHDAPKDDPLTG
jgi:hypothetical protein